MILLTRLNGVQFALNPDLIERADTTPDTVLTLVDGTKYVVCESLQDLITLVRDYRARVVASAHDISPETHVATDSLHVAEAPGRHSPSTQARVVPLHRGEH